jgi:hypothetical protein
VTRALNGAQRAGLSVRKFEIDPTGKIIVETGKPDYPIGDTSRNEWDVPPTGEIRQ